MARIIETGEALSSSPVVTIEADGKSVVIPDAHLLFNADFSRLGNDLVLVGADGKTIIILDYFATDIAVDLLSPEGSVLTGDVVGALAGPLAPAQYAQATPPAGKQPIGQVEALTGTATATRADGTIVELKVGIKVFQGDVVQTGQGSTLGITFLDETVFSLSEDSRMVLNELVYDPAGSDNSMLINLVQGGFVFVAGQIAPTGDMKVQTPVGTLGIRGTTPTVFFAEDGAVAFSIVRDPGPDGKIGTYTLFDENGKEIATVVDAGTKLILTSAGGQIEEIPKNAADLEADKEIQAQIAATFNSLQNRKANGETAVELDSFSDDVEAQPGEGKTPPGEGAAPAGEGEAPSSEGETPPGEGETPAPASSSPSASSSPTSSSISSSLASLSLSPKAAPTSDPTPVPSEPTPIVLSPTLTPQQPVVDPLTDPVENIITGTSGDENLTGTSGIDSISGFGGNDILLGDVGNDILDGGTGNDILDGGIGNDILDGGPDSDLLIGGTGSDTFVLALDSPDVVIDFELGEDFLNLSPVLDGSFTVANLNDYVQAQQTASTTIRVDTDGLANGVNFVVAAILEGINAGDDISFIFNSDGNTTSIISAPPVGQNVNAPVITSANAANVAENTTDVVQVTATDADAGDPKIFLISGITADDALFAIDGSGNLSFVAPPDFDIPGDVGGNNVYDIEISVSDGVNITPQNIAVTVTDVNDNAPVITSANTANVVENTTTVLQVTSSDEDTIGGQNFSIFGIGGDNNLFSIDGSGNITFDAAPDFEIPGDVGGDNTYDIEISVSDGVNITPQNITVTVTDENDNAPVITSANAASVAENTTTVLQVTSTDEDTVGGQNFSISGVGGDNNLFEIDGLGNLSFITPPDFEIPGDVGGDNTYDIEISVSDGVNTTPQSITVTVTDENDNAPVITSANAVSVAENTSTVLQVTSTDLDTVGVQTFSLNNAGLDEALFTIDGSGDLSFITPPDFEFPGDVGGDNTYDIEISVSDGVNITPQNIAITVTNVITEPASIIDLTFLNAAQGFVIQGDVAVDFAGYSVSSAGDINGDGFDDLIVGAYRGDDGGTDAGEAYVVFGTDTGFGSTVGDPPRQVLDLTNLTAAEGFIIQGDAAFDLAGYSVSSAGDINGDGFDDLIVGALRGEDGGADAGEAYVVFGTGTGFGSVDGAGRNVLELTNLTAAEGFIIQGDAAGDFSGVSVSSAGDINGDGFDDLIVGAALGDDGGTNAGEAYVVFGIDTGFGSVDSIGRNVLDLTNLTAAEGFIIQGDAAFDLAGVSVSSAGDINGDGFDDLIVGARFGGDAGEAYVVFGTGTGFGSTVGDPPRQVLDLTNLTAAEGFIIQGDAAGDFSGVSVSSAGDINGDGFDDLIVGTRLGGDAGEAYVVFGTNTGFGSTVGDPPRRVLDLTNLTAAEGFIIQGDEVGDNAGASVSSAGDINGDGFDDLIIGAYAGDDGGGQAGEGYVIFGSAFGGATVAVSTTGTTGADIIIGGLGNDTLVGLGGADVIRGGAGDDIIAITDDFFQRIDGGTGIDTLRIDGANFSPTSPGGDGVITNIEIADITGSGDNTIALTKLDVFGFTPERSGGIASITVVGDAGDAVSFEDLGWSVAGQVTIGADTFNRIVNGNAEVLVQDTVGTIIPGALTPVIELATLNGVNGFVINGIDVGDQSGFSVSSAGDFNGDGFDDFIIGARFADPNGQGEAGETYVVFGTAGGFGSSFELSTLAGGGGADGFVLNGLLADDYSGYAVSSGDINGDGFDDVLIGAQRSDVKGNFTGQAYVLFGEAATTFGSLDLSTLNGTNGFTLNGVAAGDGAGGAVAVAGDINGDGFEDFIIGANVASSNGANAGRAHVIFGQAGSFGTTVELSALNVANGFTMVGVNSGDNLGISVSGAGDVNGDGFADFIIGAFAADPNGSSTGESYVVFGKDTSFGALFDLTTLNGTNGFVINGIDSFDYSGGTVSSAGDINGDGFDDILIGADQADPNGNGEAGETYVIFGKASGFSASLNLSTLTAADGFVINGIDADDRSGLRISSAGDFNGDGFDDLLIGARFSDTNGIDAGESYIIFGKAGGFGTSLELSSLNGTNGFVLNGIDGGDQAGFSDSSAGDVNGDGFDDIIIGAVNADPNGSQSGESYIIFGAAFGNGVLLGTAAGETITGTAGSDNIRGLGGNDTLVGLAGADRLEGGSGTNTLTGGSDNDSFFFDDTSGVSRFDTVTDFNLIDDVLDLSNILDGSFSTGSLSDFVELRELGGGGVALVRVDSDGTANGVNFVDIADLTGIVQGNSVNFLFGGSANSSSVTVSAFNEITGSGALLGTAVDDLIEGSAGVDTLTGLGGNDILAGDSGDDTLDGGTGNDTLEGGIGSNTLTGGTGSDKFVSTDLLGFDTITDFALADDLLDVSALLDANFTVGNQATYIQALDNFTGNTDINIDPDGAAGGSNFVNVASLTGIAAGATINFIFDDVGSQSNIVSDFALG